jgi:signal transduction histidine kinase
VTLGLGFEPGHVTVSVTNPLLPASAEAPLATTGAGAGLIGLKERAALVGGTLEAGPADGTWRIDLGACRRARSAT